MAGGESMVAECSRCHQVKPGPAPRAPLGRSARPFVCADCMRTAGSAKP